MKFVFFALFWCLVVTASVNGSRATKIIKFLMKNHDLCGKPFADAEWIPVLDVCDRECDDASELCVENDDLVQKCNKRESISLFIGQYP